MLNTSEPAQAAAPRTDALGRVLITAYLILALAATLRAVYQLITKFDEAPVAYTLSLLSGLVYIVATVALIKRRGGWSTVAWIALIFEFAGVVVVGTLSLTVPEMFAHDSVWSMYGSGYLWVPLVLPVLGMIWLRRDGRRVRTDASHPRSEAAAQSTEQAGRAATSESEGTR